MNECERRYDIGLFSWFRMTMMKRRDCTVTLMFVLMSAGLTGCSALGFSFGKEYEESEEAESGGSSRDRSGRSNSRRRRRRSSSISDLKTLAKLLQQARRPLTDTQVDYLLTLKPGPEFTAKMGDILTDPQKEALKNSGGRRLRRRSR